MSQKWELYMSLFIIMQEQNINVSKYKPLSDSSSIKLSKELKHSRKCLINIQIADDKDI